MKWKIVQNFSINFVRKHYKHIITYILKNKLLLPLHYPMSYSGRITSRHVIRFNFIILYFMIILIQKLFFSHSEHLLTVIQSNGIGYLFKFDSCSSRCSPVHLDGERVAESASVEIICCISSFTLNHPFTI